MRAGSLRDQGPRLRPAKLRYPRKRPGGHLLPPCGRKQRQPRRDGASRDNDHALPLSNRPQDHRTRLTSFRRRHQRVIVRLVTQEVQFDLHARGPRPLREIDAIRIEQITRAREDRHRREPTEGTVQGADEGMADIEIACIEPSRRRGAIDRPSPIFVSVTSTRRPSPVGSNEAGSNASFCTCAWTASTDASCFLYGSCRSSMLKARLVEADYFSAPLLMRRNQPMVISSSSTVRTSTR